MIWDLETTDGVNYSALMAIYCRFRRQARPRQRARGNPRAGVGTAEKSERSPPVPQSRQAEQQIYDPGHASAVTWHLTEDL